MMATGQDRSFKGRHFTSEVILWALRWYLAFSISYRDLAAMLLDRSVTVDHTTRFRWVQTYAAKLEQRVRRHLRPCTGFWRVDETCIKVKGAWTYLYRAVDSLGQTIDFVLSPRRDAGGEAVLPQGAGLAAHREPTDDHGGQEPRLPTCRGRHEASG
jgi:transposase-like protein